MPLNKEITLTGNVGKNMESKYTDTGKLLCTFSLAVSVGRGDEKETEWYDCVAWENTAEIISKFAGKGSKLQVRGDFKLNLWKAKDSGEPRGKIVVTVKDFQFLSSKKEQEHSDDEDLPEFMRD